MSFYLHSVMKKKREKKFESFNQYHTTYEKNPPYHLRINILKFKKLNLLYFLLVCIIFVINLIYNKFYIL